MGKRKRDFVISEIRLGTEPNLRVNKIPPYLFFVLRKEIIEQTLQKEKELDYSMYGPDIADMLETYDATTASEQS